MKPHNIAIWLLTTLGVVLCAVAILLFMQKESPPASFQKPLIYPRAYGVKLDDPGGTGTKEITFQTMDKYEAVLKFYRDKLVREGWTVVAVPDPKFKGLYMVWRDGHIPSYVIEVVSKGGNGEELTVELSLICRCTTL